MPVSFPPSCAPHRFCPTVYRSSPSDRVARSSVSPGLFLSGPKYTCSIFAASFQEPTAPSCLASRPSLNPCLFEWRERATTFYIVVLFLALERRFNKPDKILDGASYRCDSRCLGKIRETPPPPALSSRNPKAILPFASSLEKC